MRGFSGGVSRGVESVSGRYRFRAEAPMACFPVISISKRRLKQLEAIQLVREQRENRKQTIAY